LSDINEVRIAGDRLWNSLMEMARIGATAKGGCNRQALSDEDRAGRELFIEWCEAAGCTVRVDAIGNLFARRPGRDETLAPVMAGSHLDTQPAGGRFDGVYGVLAGLEVVRTLNDATITTEGPIEIAAWTNEEGARFAPAMLGSGVWAGVFDLDESYAIVDRTGCRLGDELDRIGFKGPVETAVRRPHAAFEVHIEQGPILEDARQQIGIVTGVQGMRWYDLTIDGQSCHAGTTPMELRDDPVRHMVTMLRELYALIDDNGPGARVTFGEITTHPASRNTVPERVAVTVDLRHPEETVLEGLEVSMNEVVSAVSGAGVDRIWASAAIDFDAQCMHAVAASAKALGYSHRRMVSGAGHDSVYVSRVAPTGMIFIPCENGLSHTEVENADPDDITAGCNVLLHAMLARDRHR
jgi:beta-ureidopropionase / N-carbamoyl-L-amino-acid hydrolase